MRTLILLSLLAFSMSAFANERAVVMTFLKAHPGQSEQLAQFIRKNWFAMDKIAVEQGLFAHYSLLKNTDKSADWDYIVQVTYRDKNGYAGVKQPFEKIRTAHQTVLIEGKSFGELGRVVRTWQTLEPLE